MLKNWLGLTFFLTLGILFYVFYGELDSTIVNPIVPEMPAPENQPTARAADVVSQKFRIDGGTDFYFVTAAAQYFQKDAKVRSPGDYAFLTQPLATFFELNKEEVNTPSWQLKADKGEAREEMKMVQLFDNVEVWKPESLEEYTHISTSYLELDTENQFVFTDKHVVIKYPNNIKTAAVLRADLKHETYRFQRSETIHEPKRKP